jgi:hypothetical protein
MAFDGILIISLLENEIMDKRVNYERMVSRNKKKKHLSKPKSAVRDPARREAN